MKHLNTLRDKIYNYALYYGWHVEKYCNEHWLCLVISELMGAVQADINRKWARRDIYENNVLSHFCYDDLIKRSYDEFIKGSMEDKLADACIRLFDYAGLREIDLDEFEYEEGAVLRFYGESFTKSIYKICGDIADITMIDDPCHMLDAIFTLCRERKIDIMWHIEQKMKYNELRPYMHGDKAY